MPIRPLPRIMRDQLQITVSGKMWLDITHKSASKGTAIRYIQEKFNIGFEQTMAFGDYFKRRDAAAKCPAQLCDGKCPPLKLKNTPAS